MKKIWLSVALAGLFLATGTAASATGFPLVDTGLLTHMVYGKGIEIRVRPDPMPSGGLQDDAVWAALQGVCDHYAPVVVPFVGEHLDVTDARFVAVRVVSSGGLSDFRLRVFRLDGRNCGDPL